MEGNLNWLNIGRNKLAGKYYFCLYGGVDTTSIGSRVRIVRERLRMTQEGFADKLGVSQATVSQWEQGLVQPRLPRVESIAALGRVEFAWLLLGVPPKTRRGRNV